MQRQLEDRIETFDEEAPGKCSCGEPVVLVSNSSVSQWRDKVRFRYPEDTTTAWNIFRCRKCGEVIHETFEPDQL